ncbi:hypothetical protein D3C75_656090 [compost metagenome]
MIADVLEGAAFILEFKVVPVLATHKRTGVAVLQFEVVNTLEDLREGFTLLEIQSPVVTGRRLAGAAVDDAHQGFIRITHAPARADRQRGVERPLDLPDVE